jgi:hypothetical protein
MEARVHREEQGRRRSPSVDVVASGVAARSALVLVWKEEKENGGGMEFERGEGRHGINGRACPSRNQCLRDWRIYGKRLGFPPPNSPSRRPPRTDGRVQPGQQRATTFTPAHVRTARGASNLARIWLEDGR